MALESSTPTMPATQSPHRDDQPAQTIRFQSQPTFQHELTEDFETFWSLISSDWRKKFHKTIDKLKFFAQTKALVTFLKDCIVKKVFPKTFEIKINQDQRFSDNANKKLLNSLKQMQIEHLKLAIKEHQSREVQLFQDYLALKTDLKLYLETSEMHLLERELQKRLEKFIENERNKYKCKLFKLQSKKSVNPEPTQGQGTQTEGQKRRRRFIKRSRYRRIQTKLSKKPLQNLVINYSDHELTTDQQSLLNKHLSFVPVPEKVNLTQLEYDYKRFSRSMRWREYWQKNNEESNESENSAVYIFPTKKHGVPTEQPTRTLNEFLYGIKCDLMTLDKKKIYSNLTQGERSALNQLIEEQKSGKIVIQKSDKGGAITIMNRRDYVRAITEEHLQSKIIKEDGTVIPVYRQIDPVVVLAHHGVIKQFLEKSVTDKVIDKKLGDQLLPEIHAEGRAYGLPKAHKEVEEGKNLPPLRLVISGCESNTENISHFLNHVTKHIPEKMDSFLQDTPDLLRKLEQYNNNNIIPDNALLVTIDVVGLYPNIPQDEGITAFEKVTNNPAYRDQTIPTCFLLKLLQFVLQFNTFVFDTEYYVQMFGTSIGTRVAPVYANIFMAELEKKMLTEWNGCIPEIWSRYIDDIISMFFCSENQLLKFIEYISSYHPTIKFTCEYRTRTEIVKTKWKNNVLEVKRSPLGSLRPRSIDFLDTTIWINDNGKFETDLFVKSTDRITYLLPQSCHPKFITSNIPYSLGYRLKRICSSNENYKIRLEELRQNLLSRGYKNKVIQTAFDKLNSLTRSDSLKRVAKNNNRDRVMLSITYDPRTTNMSKSIGKHYRFAKRNPDFLRAFPQMPMVGYKRARNLSEHLVRAKLYPVENYNLRSRNGFFKCSKKDIGCSLCKSRENTVKHVASASKKSYDIKTRISCKDTFVIYSIECKKCDKQYVGQTIQPIYRRYLNHFYDVLDKKVEKPVPKHFTSRNHGINDMIFTPFEKLYKKDKTLLDTREKYWILEKDCLKNGLNRIL